MVAFGNAEVMMRVFPWRPDGCYQQAGKSGPHDVSLWFYTDQIDSLYELLAAVAAEPAGGHSIEFIEDIYDPFYGGRQFSIRDLNGYTRVFFEGGLVREIR